MLEGGLSAVFVSCFSLLVREFSFGRTVFLHGSFFYFKNKFAFVEKGGSFVVMKDGNNILEKEWESVKIKTSIIKKARDFKKETGLSLSFIIGRAIDAFIDNYRKRKTK